MSRAASQLNHDHSYIHDQGVAALQWVVTHNLGRRPSITVVDSAGNVMQGHRFYVNDNIVIITFNFAVLGKAYLN